eukprot:s822_g16.t1
MDTRQAFLGSMVMARHWPEAVQLFDTWRSYPERGPPVRHLERKSDLLPALQVCRATGEVAQALALLRDVTARRWRIDAEAMAMAIQACRKERRWQQALALWDETRQVGLLDSPKPQFSALSWPMALALADGSCEVMQRVSFSLTALDVRMVDPVQSLDNLNLPKWCKGSGIAKVPVVRLFGISRQGASVCAHVHGSWPFFYAELSEELAQQLTCTDTDDEIAQPAQLAASIEDAVNHRRVGRAVKVVNLKLERWRSVYGLHLAAAPFLRVELLDSRDVEPVAAALQNGEVPVLGNAQAHEAHLPFLLHFLSEHHLSGAGLVRVSGTERGSRLSCCTVECLDRCCELEAEP